MFYPAKNYAFSLHKNFITPTYFLSANKGGAILPQVIRQIIWKIISFFGTFFKVKYLLIGDDL